MAMGTLIVSAPQLITFVAARQIIAGLTAGVVKG
jgi:ABC-type glycerol-3-phosphate transport system permease component